MKIFRLLTSILPLSVCALADNLTCQAVLNPTVDSNAVQVNPVRGGTYPRTIALRDGSILAVVTAFVGSTHELTITRSTDGGSSFQPWGSVGTGTNDLDNGNLVQLPNGDIVCTFRNHTTDGTTRTFYRITARVSHDNGKTWIFLSQVDQRDASEANATLWEPFGRVAKSGALQVYYSAGNNAKGQDIVMRSSGDGGLTWGDTITVSGGQANNDAMTGCVGFTVNGQAKLMCVFQTNEVSGKLSIKSVISNDDGASWGSRAQVYIPTGTNSSAGAPQIVATTGGALIVSFMTDEDTLPHQWIYGNTSMKIVTSAASDPAVWGCKVTVSDGQSRWPGTMVKSDDSVLGCHGVDNIGAVCHQIHFSRVYVGLLSCLQTCGSNPFMLEL